LFGLPRYREVAEAYIAGINARITAGKSVKHIASVASFFLSRIDTLIDPMLEDRISSHAEMADFAAQLKGQIAIASAKLAAKISDEIFNSHSFKKLAAKGASRQRLLWASTSTKNPEYSDVKYIEALIGPDTVNTLPLETIEAYYDHGDPTVSINLDVEKAHFFFQTLSELGIDVNQITQQLEDDGVNKFIKSYDQLLETLQKNIQG
jgi:transaldolase